MKKIVTSSFIFFLLFTCNSVAMAEMQISPITQRTWSNILLEISDNSEKQYKGLDFPYPRAVEAYRENLTSNMDSWTTQDHIFHCIFVKYYMAVCLIRGSNKWKNVRGNTLKLQRTLIKHGVDSYVLETSFYNMNRAARSLGLPLARDIN